MMVSKEPTVTSEKDIRDDEMCVTSISLHRKVWDDLEIVRTRENRVSGKKESKAAIVEKCLRRYIAEKKTYLH